jgi:cell division septum initiation protein DivIVA
MAGSGDALLAQLTGAQGSAGDTYQAGLDRAAMGAARRDAAAQAAGNMAATLGNEQGSIDTNRASGLDAYGNAGAQGKDAYSQWNAQHVFDTNKYNSDALTQQLKDQSARERGVLDANTATHNQTVQGNNALQQQHFNNTMAVMGGATGQMNNQAGTLSQNAVYPLQDAILPAASGVTKAVV